MRVRTDRMAAVAALLLATAFCVALVAARALYVGWTYGFLVWNLTGFLTWTYLVLVSFARLAPGAGSRPS